MKVKIKICKNCWKEFTPYNSLIKCCSYKCENILAKKKDKEKKAKVREKKKVSVSALTKLADKLWSDLVKLQWGNKCAYCWKKEYLNSHHLFTRSRRATRWDTDNWICLCSWHHTLSSEFSAHQTSLEFFLWLEDKFWRDWIEVRKEKSLQVYKTSSEDLQEIIKWLKEEIKLFDKQ